MKRVIALLLALILFAGVLPIDAAATEQEFVNVQLILDGKPRQYKVIESGSELMFSGEDLAAMGGYEYRVEKDSAYFTRGMKTLRVDLDESRMYPFEDITLVGKVKMAEKVREVDSVYYFPGTEMLPWLNVDCFVLDGQLNICKDEVSIWEIIPVFDPEEFEFDFTACCKELGVNGKYLKARAYLQDEGLTGMFFDIIPVVGDSLDYYDLFEDIVQDQSAADEEIDEMLEDAEDVSYWMEIADDFEVIEDLPDELRLFGEVANFLSNNAVSFSFELASYVKNYYQNHENILAAFHSMIVNSGVYKHQLPMTAISALMEVEESYTDYYAGIEYKMMKTIGETAFEGLASVPSGLFEAATTLVGFAEATSPDWAEGINRISSYDMIAEYCVRTYGELTDHTWMSSIKDMCGLAYMYLYSCEQNWNAMADYAIKEGKLDLAAEYRAMAESTEEWQRKFMEAVPAAMNDSHEYEVVDGSMKQGYTDKLTRMFGDVEKQPDLLSQEKRFLEYLQNHPEYNYYAILDVNCDGNLELLATDRPYTTFGVHFYVDLYVNKNDKIELVREDIWAKYGSIKYDPKNRWIETLNGGTSGYGSTFLYFDTFGTVQETSYDHRCHRVDESGNEIWTDYYNDEEVNDKTQADFDALLSKYRNGDSKEIEFKQVPLPNMSDFLGQDISVAVESIGSDYIDEYMFGGRCYTYEDIGVVFFFEDPDGNRITVHDIMCFYDADYGYGFSARMTYPEICANFAKFSDLDLDEPEYYYNMLDDQEEYDLEFILEGVKYRFVWLDDPSCSKSYEMELSIAFNTARETFTEEVQAKYGIASSTEFISCIDRSIQEYPTSVFGYVTEASVDLDSNGKKERIVVRSREDSLFLQVYAESKGRYILLCEEWITLLDYGRQQDVSLFYSEALGGYAVLCDASLSDPTTGFEGCFASLYSVTLSGVDLCCSINEMDYDTKKEDIPDILAEYGVPYAENCARIDNITPQSQYIELVEVYHRGFDLYPSGDREGQEHHLQLITPEVRNRPVDDVQTWTITVQGYQGWTEYREETWTQEFKTGNVYTIRPTWKDGVATDYSVLWYTVDTQERTIEIGMDYAEGDSYWCGLVLDLVENTYYGLDYTTFDS